MARITPRPHLGKHLTAAIGFAALVGLAAAPAHAYELNVSASPDLGNPAATGAAPNILPEAGPFTVSDPAVYNGTSGGTTTVPELVIIYGELNGAGPAPTISFTASGCPLCSGTVAESYAGSLSLSASSPKYAYAAVGATNVAEPTHGDSGAAFATDDAAAFGLTPTSSFSLYTYTISLSSGMTADTSLSLNINGATPGSFIEALSCTAGSLSLSSGGCASGDGIASFIQDAGLVDPPDDPVPEPSSLLLFGTALTGLTVMRRRRRTS